MSWNTKIPKFRRFVLQNFPFIEQDFDALTDYQLICKVVEYLNKVIDSQNNLIEQVDTFENLFLELKDYVDHYFDNLDVQEEINNKLDAMVEDGQLTQLIAQFLTLNAVMSFASVADMKNAENLVNGSTVETYGYYAIGDKGGAKYRIRTVTNSDTIDEITLFALTNSETLIAELIIDSSMDVRQYGAKGDGSTDDTTRIQKALDTVSNVTFADGTYMVNAVTHILPNTGNKLILNNNATIKAITNDEDHYDVIYLNNVNNVEICGGTIEGDRSTHTGATGEWGHCVSIMNGSSKIYIHDINLINAWGDGIYFNDCSNVHTARVHVNNARRNGYSIIAMTDYLSEDDLIENTSGTNPQAGVDIEPNENANVINNITFNNLTSNNNTNAGLAIHENVTNTVSSNITVNNLYANGNQDGILLELYDNFSGNITINDCKIIDSKRHGIFGNNTNYSANYAVYINNPYINGVSKGESVDNGSGIVFQSQSGHEGGNIYIESPIILNRVGTATSSHDIFLSSRGSTYPWHTFIVNNPLKGSDILIGYGLDVHINDKYEITAKNITANEAVKNEYHSIYTNTGADASVRASVAQNTTVKNEVLTFRVTEAQTMVVRFTDQYIYPLSTSISQDVTLSGIGSSMTIKKISDTNWVVLNSNGSVSV